MRTYTAAIGDYPHTAAVKAGERLTGCRLEFAAVEPIHRAFAPMVRSLRFDFAELALATCLQAHEAGAGISLLPLVLHGNFHHRSIWRLTGGPGPAGLAGARVGVRAYTQTTGLWVRGFLAEDHGVDLDGITWVTTEGPQVAGYAEPPNVTRVPGRLADLLEAGEVAALVMGPRAVPEGAPLEPLLPDWRDEQRAWFARHGTVPVNHLLTVRTNVLHADPGAVREVYHALAAEIDVHQGGKPHRIRHGVEAVAEAVRIAVRYALGQQLITKAPTVEELFAGFRRYVQ